MQSPSSEGGCIRGRQSGRKCGEVDKSKSEHGTLMHKSCLLSASHSKQFPAMKMWVWVGYKERHESSF